MIDINKFNALEKASTASFNQQKILIKKLMSGQKVLCPHCGQVLKLELPNGNKQTGIYCAKGCTDILLEFN